MRKTPLKACPRVTRKMLARFLRQHADDLPPSAIRKAVAQLKAWVAKCDAKGVAAAMRYEQNDWYLCTLKNAAVRPDLRGQGHGRKLYQDTARKALSNKDCKVLAADVTVTNTPSIKALERVGFKPINRFCWKKGEKPAAVLHYVKLPPKKGGETC